MKGMMIVLIISLPFFCFGGEGKTAAGFLKFSHSARQASVGGSYSAFEGGSEIIFSNPAGLSTSQTKEITIGFVSYLLNSKMGILSYKTKYRDWYLGFGLAGFDIGSIERRTNDVVGIVPSEGSFSARDMVFIMAYAKDNFAPSLIDNLHFGINFKFINSKIDSSSAFSFAADAGFLYKYSDRINISFVLSNLGTKMKYEDESDNIPLSLKTGFLYSFDKKLNLSAEIEEFVYDEKFYSSVGAEWFLKESFALRSGYRFGYDTSNLGGITGFSFGFGIITKDVGFNYAYVPFGELGDIHRFDIQLRF